MLKECNKNINEFKLRSTIENGYYDEALKVYLFISTRI